MKEIVFFDFIKNKGDLQQIALDRDNYASMCNAGIPVIS